MHTLIKASQLRDGHLLRLGVSTNYVKVASAAVTEDGEVAVTVYNGETPNARPFRCFGASEDVQVTTLSNVA